jgi:hypothetical protein
VSEIVLVPVVGLVIERSTTEDENEEEDEHEHELRKRITRVPR